MFAQRRTSRNPWWASTPLFSALKGRRITELRHIQAQRAAIIQPRASPWVTSDHQVRALKGRNICSFHGVARRGRGKRSRQRVKVEIADRFVPTAFILLWLHPMPTGSARASGILPPFLLDNMRGARRIGPKGDQAKAGMEMPSRIVKGQKTNEEVLRIMSRRLKTWGHPP